MKSFNRKLIYITGGSSGIGLAAAAAFLREGASVHLFARNPERLASAREHLLKENPTVIPEMIKASSLDVSDNADVKRVLSDAMKEGVPDVVVNCAGIAYPDYFENISYEIFRKTISVNLEGPWNVLSAVLPDMKKKGCGGHIVTTSSVAGFVGTFGYSAYSASKFGVIGLSETLRGELKAFGISVSVLCPPDTDTPGYAEENKTKPAETIAISGNVRLMSPQEVAGCLLKGLKKKRFLIIPGFMARITFLLKSILPSLVYMIMDSDAEKAKSTER